ncbi:MAG: hypothetical protein EXR75_09655 [Myxococcales bacterium]|nr:hypothetical protein [Myxococcales bacterium]
MTADLDTIRRAYSAFLRPGRVLLSGHSHQAWPDVARQAQLEVFDDAAQWVDEKWERAIFPLVDEVGRGVLTRMGFAPTDAIAFAESTHELVVRLFSALDLARTRVVTTTGEFHSLDRQLRRFAEDGTTLHWVDASPRTGLAERLIAAIERERGGDGPLVVALSAVLFEDAYVMPELGRILAHADAAGALTLVDAYHAYNVVPLGAGTLPESAFVVAGGYKYAGFGNGVCWMRIPPECALRPRYTGWFSDYASLAEPRTTERPPVRYGSGGARFAGATFEASGFYRARAALRQFDALGLTVEALRAISTRQTRRIIDGLAAHGVLADDAGALANGGALDDGGICEGSLRLVSSDDDARRGGFVALGHPRAAELVTKLSRLGVLTDARGSRLRLGPAPYLSDEELDRGVSVLAELVRS